MTKEETKKLVEVMQAYINGKEIEVQNNGEWHVITSPEWHSDRKYRIKPESKYRPFENEEECWQEMQKHKPFGWLRASHGKFLIIGIRKDDIILGTIDNKLTYNYVFSNYKFLDETPFGIKFE